MRHILITGASSGIGAALARAYAAPGVMLSISGRDQARLHAVAEACDLKGASVAALCLDVTDAPGVEAWIRGNDAARPLDIVIANAGVSAGTGSAGESATQARRIFETNLTGVLNTVLPAVELMRPRRRGHIALMSSLAAYRGIGGAPAYSGSKAAVKVWGEGLRNALARDGIGVSVICPGFVESRITAVNKFPMPLLMDADRAAQIIQRGIAANKGRIAFPWPMAALSWLLSVLPDAAASAITSRLPLKD